MPSRDTMIRDLREAARTGGEVVETARKLGYQGKSLMTLDDAQLDALYRAVWPETPAPMTLEQVKAFDDNLPF